MTGKEVAQKIIEHVEKAEDYNARLIGRYDPAIPGGWKNVPEGHAWISNFDVEDLWNNKNSPNLKPKCKKIVEVLEKWLSGQTNKEINKVENRKPRVVIDLNDYYKVGDVVELALDGPAMDRDDYQLFVITELSKTKAIVAELPCKTNVNEVLRGINYYGESAKWYRKYRKEDFTKPLPITWKVNAKDLGIQTLRGKILDYTELYKFYDKSSDTILKKQWIGCNEFVLENDKYWYD